MQESSLPELPHVVRGACLLAASVASIGTLTTLLTIWHQQADSLWLPAMPEVLAKVAVCDQASDRTRRTQC